MSIEKNVILTRKAFCCDFPIVMKSSSNIVKAEPRTACSVLGDVNVTEILLESSQNCFWENPFEIPSQMR